MSDIQSEQSSQSDTSKDANKLATYILDQIKNAVIATDENNSIIYWNKYAENIFGYTKKEVLGKNILETILPLNLQDSGKEMLSNLLNNGEWQGEITAQKKDGSSFICSMSLSNLEDSNKKIIGTISICADITEKKKYEEDMKDLIEIDPLTKLLNRNVLREKFEDSMKEAKDNNKMLAILFLDLDRFKFINDTLGHILGDQLLKDIADRMRECVEPHNIIARIGGDEFMILLKNVTEINDVTRVAQQILSTFERSFTLEEHEIHITASIGISLYPHDGDDTKTLLRNADTAMYRAKEQGKNSFELYSPILNEKAMEKLMLENSLQRALERNELLLYYQPLIDVATKKIVGMEALLRWNHPTLGLIPPGEFIPLAEETGVIIPITQWVLEVSCNQCKTWQEMGIPDLYMAVNISGQHLKKKNWEKMIEEVLDKTQMDPHFLELEISENSIMKNTPQTLKMLETLQEKGVHFSIDDFGTGYSSLSYLTHFPINGLKIDQSFMRYITTDSDDAAIINAIVYMAHNLDLKVVAEGIETAEQFKFISSIHCDLAQGYLFSKPIPPEQMTKLLVQNRLS